MLYFARWKIALIALVVVVGFFAALPSFISRTTLEALPSWFPKRQIVLGLDLQGGAYLLYQVDKQDYVQKRLRELVGEVRKALNETPRIGYTGLGVVNDGVQVRIRDVAQVDEARKRLAPLQNQLASSLFSRGGAVNEFDINAGSDGLIRFTYSQAGLQNRMHSIVQQSIQVINRRINQLGTTEPNIQPEGSDRILVEAPGLNDPQRLKDLIGQTAQLTFHLVDTTVPPQQAVQSGPPPGDEILYNKDKEPVVVQQIPLLTGEDLVDAQATFNRQSNEPIVDFRLTTGGARTFGQVTAANVGKPFAIVLDNVVLSAPVIREPIPGGQGQISGNFTIQSANDLAILLRAGALPAKLTIVEERSVGPGLGADSIAAGEVAGVVAVLFVCAAMIVVYGLFGLFAIGALFVNLILLFGAMSILGSTLTLPGIAGIVLTMGMAVDSNVLIYERIRDEARGGRSAINAIDVGFQRAFGTILDANITTLIAGLVLFYLGSGPVRGFAVTLSIGIVTTVFTAFTVTRLFVAQWVRRRRPTVVPI